MTLKCAEFFSGIGGMHWSLLDAGLGEEVQVIRAFDINANANQVYESNFGLKPVTANVEHLTVEYYEKMAAEVWLMSPPCQPFTRGGLQQDAQDPRSTGFLYLLQVLSSMKNPPKYLFLENVLNFEVSQCHEELIEVLVTLNYEIEEFLVEPTDPSIGIPNSRLRYYLSARRSDSKSEYTGIIHKSLVKVTGNSADEEPPRTLSAYLTSEGDKDPSFLVPIAYLENHKTFRHDIVTGDSTRSATFTKAYGSKHIIGTGSLIQTKDFERIYQNDDLEAVSSIGLRFFTPMEIAKLHGLPTDSNRRFVKSFFFPTKTTRAQQYKLLGNSLNIKVVSFILKRLIQRE